MTYANPQLERVAAGLQMDALRRAPIVVAQKRSPWAEDYAATRKVPNLDASRLDDGGGGDSAGAGGSARESWLVSGYRRLGEVVRREVTAFCPGTKVFMLCVGVVAFIAVV